MAELKQLIKDKRLKFLHITGRIHQISQYKEMFLVIKL